MGSRIEELRTKMAEDPGSRIFAQLAEELRKSGDLDEAIEVCSRGLKKHPNYWSARLTFARALLEKNDLLKAIVEFESIQKSAPDNVFVRRYYGECLERIGKKKDALAKYREALVYAPQDDWCRKRIEAILRESVGESEDKKYSSEERDEEKESESEDNLISPTLAELYSSQGHVTQAIEVYRRLLERKESVEYRQRLNELLAGARDGAERHERNGNQRAIKALELYLSRIRR